MNKSEQMIVKIGELKRNSFRNPQLAFDESEQILNEARTCGCHEVEAHALIAMALACRSMTKLSACFEYASRANRIFERLENGLGIATALNVLGVVYFYYAMFEQALEHFLKALKFLKSSDDYITMSRLYNNIGEVYREANQLGEALQYYEKALELCQTHHYRLNTAVILENIGEIYFLQEQLDACFIAYQKSYAILSENEDLTALSELENRLGRVHFKKGQYDEAKAYYLSALERLDQIGNQYFALDVLIDLAILEEDGDENLFLHYLNRGLIYGEAIQARKKLSLIYKLLSQHYEKNKQFEFALEYYKQLHRLEQLIETAAISHKLEIIKIEVGQLVSGEEVEKVFQLNAQLEQNIIQQEKMMAALETTNRLLNAQVIADELTQMPNRRGIREVLSKEWFVTEPSTPYFGLMMMDIDRFKQYNDCHGHLIGDQSLKEIARVLVESFGKRKGVVGRFGGEEFTCFVKGESVEMIHQLAESFRLAVEALNLMYQVDNAVNCLTISIGLCCGLGTAFKQPDEMYALADCELYRAKSNGRNQVCTYLSNDKRNAS